VALTGSDAAADRGKGEEVLRVSGVSEGASDKRVRSKGPSNRLEVSLTERR